MISFEYDLDFRRTYQAETILVVSGKRCISSKHIKLGLRVGRKKSTQTLKNAGGKKKGLEEVRCETRKT